MVVVVVMAVVRINTVRAATGNVECPNDSRDTNIALQLDGEELLAVFFACNVYHSRGCPKQYYPFLFGGLQTDRSRVFAQ